MKIPAWAGITIGCIMIVQWVYFLLSGAVPELQSTPLVASLHLAAEFATAFSLVISGLGVLKDRSWGPTGLLVASGMLAYSLVNSFSYYPQNHQWSIVSIFAVLLTMAIRVVKNVIVWQRTQKNG